MLSRSASCSASLDNVAVAAVVSSTMAALCWVVWSIWLIADVIWWILPSVPHEYTTLHLPMAFGAILGVGGLWGLFFCRELAKRPIMPNNSEGRFLAAWGHH